MDAASFLKLGKFYPAFMIDHAILLSAGQGSRLLPLTVELPKCLIEFSGRSLLEWQIEMLTRCGIKRIDVVVGFKAEMVEGLLAQRVYPSVDIAVHYNPFYQVADNLGSCWIVRERMEGDFLLLNGDTLVPESIVRAVVEAQSAWPITVTIDRKESYDSDDMKVSLDGARLVSIGKMLTPAVSHAESIGFVAFRGQGAEVFRTAVCQAMRKPEGVQHWYLKVIDSLAATGCVGVFSIEGLPWAEVDYLTDIEIATELTDTWCRQMESSPLMTL